jgi:hypothetical protein
VVEGRVAGDPDDPVIDWVDDVHRGSDMRRWRAIGGGLGVLVLGAGVLTGCTRELKEVTGVLHADSNDAGTIVVCVNGPDGGSGFEIAPGATERAPLVMPDGRAVCPRAVNDAGDIAGSVGYGEPERAVVRRNGRWKELPSPLPAGSPGTPFAWATDINDAGRVVGVGPTDDVYGPRAVVWDADTGAVQTLERDGIPVAADGALIDAADRMVAYGSGLVVCATPTSCRPSLADVGFTTGAGVNDNGTFVVSLDVHPARGGHYMVTRRGDHTGLGESIQLPGWFGFVANDIADDGTMVGYGRRTDAEPDRALRVRPDLAVEELAPDATGSQALSIDGRGRVVGTLTKGGITQLVEWS